MSVLDFVASLVSALAWPLAAVGIALLFRKQLISLLSVAGPLKRLKGPGGLEAFYDETLQEAEQSAAEVLAAAGPGDPPTTGRLADLRALALDHPHAAILEASRRIEMRLAEILQSDQASSLPRVASMAGLAQEAYKRDLIEGVTLDLIADLRTLRNVAVHGRAKFDDGTEVQITTERALEFLSVAEAAMAGLYRHRGP